MKNNQLFRLIAKSALVVAITVSTFFSSSTLRGDDGTPSDSAPFSGMYVFGDSLSDTGNVFSATKELPGGPLPPEPFYSKGRFSNGDIWVEHLAEMMKLDPESVVNSAFGGATTGIENATFPGLPGLQVQIELFRAKLNGKKADKRALYVVWAGANDFYATTDPFQTIETAVEKTLDAVESLYNAGARRIMVVNMPDLGLTPDARVSGQQGVLSFLSTIYNLNLDFALDQLADYGIETVRLDSAGVLQAIVESPSDFGFANVTEAYFPDYFFQAPPFEDPSTFLYWDSVHPTTEGHRVIADEALSVLRSKYRHVWGTPKK